MAGLCTAAVWNQRRTQKSSSVQISTGNHLRLDCVRVSERKRQNWGTVCAKLFIRPLVSYPFAARPVKSKFEHPVSNTLPPS